MKSFFGKRPAVVRGTGGTDGGGEQAHRTERIGEKGREGELGKRSGSGRRENGGRRGREEEQGSGRRRDGGGCEKAPASKTASGPGREKRCQKTPPRSFCRLRMSRHVSPGLRGRPGTPRVLSALSRPFGVPSGRRVRRGGIRARDGCVDCRRVAAAGRMLSAFFVLSAVFSLSSDTLTTG